MHQIKILLNRSNAVLDPKSNFNACTDFLDLITDASFLAAAMTFFGMANLLSPPSTNAPSLEILQGSYNDKQEYLNKVVASIVDKYILKQVSGYEAKDCANEFTEDGVFNYACSLLAYGLFARCLLDASREGDGARTLLYWKFLLLHFREDHATKYAQEAFYLLAQTNSVLTQRESHELIWNRTCSTTGRPGSNIELDLHMEHLNRNFKDDLNTFRHHITDKSIQRSSYPIGKVNEILKNFSHEHNVNKDSGRHKIPETQDDLCTVLNELVKENVFERIPGRYHWAYQHFENSPFKKTNTNIIGLYKWLTRKRKELHMLSVMV